MEDCRYYAVEAAHPTPASKPLLINALDRAFANLPNKRPDWEFDKDTLLKCILNSLDPSEYFDCVGYGAFKETYELSGTGDYIFKLCSQKNDTDAEIALLDVAREEGVAHFFLNTQIIPLFGYALPMPVILEQGDCSSGLEWDENRSAFVDYPDWDGRYATHIMIQPRVDSLGTDHEYWAYEECAAYPIVTNTDPDIPPLTNPITGEIIDDEPVDILNIHCLEWLQNFLYYYGKEDLYKLANFVRRYHIGDLHNGNLGFIRRHFNDSIPVPVILDWLSPDSKWIHERAANLP